MISFGGGGVPQRIYSLPVTQRGPMLYYMYPPVADCIFSPTLEVIFRKLILYQSQSGVMVGCKTLELHDNQRERF